MTDRRDIRSWPHHQSTVSVRTSTNARPAGSMIDGCSVKSLLAAVAVGLAVLASAALATAPDRPPVPPGFAVVTRADDDGARRARYASTFRGSNDGAAGHVWIAGHFAGAPFGLRSQPLFGISRRHLNHDGYGHSPFSGRPLGAIVKKHEAMSC